MAGREALKTWVYEAAKANGGETSPTEAAKYIWKHHEDELRRSGDLFYTWQYSMRWAATALRKEGKFGNGWNIVE